MRIASPMVQASYLRILEDVGKPEFGLGAALRLLRLCQVRKSIKMTPAVAEGLTDHIWTMENAFDYINALFVNRYT